MRPSQLRAARAGLILVTCAHLFGCATRAPSPRPGFAEKPAIHATPQIIGPNAQGTVAELFEAGERALLAERWTDAKSTFETLLAGAPDLAAADRARALLDLAYADEGLGLREAARDRYHEVATRFPATLAARTALARAAAVHASLEDWPGLEVTGDALLAAPDAAFEDRVAALGARGLARVEQGDDARAMKDVQDGLDLAEEHRYGMTGRLPVAVAELRFALGEIRRVRSERIALAPPPGVPVTPEFLVRIEIRCQGLREAQDAYTDAIRSVDPRWAEMSGYRIGEMYRTLHRDLMAIPPSQAKTERDRQIFYAMMHVRYRVFLEKGLEMMNRTLALAEKTHDASPWIRRTTAAAREIELALRDEKAEIAKYPFNEAEVEAALALLQAKAERGLGSKKRPGERCAATSECATGFDCCPPTEGGPAVCRPGCPR